ncbi:hypothetical protein PG997_004180 [Apiospora hydei]|uniref:Cytochrome b-c1 complex subunit 8 n=1 Tax=Apiospora hydei TaxID=1337664 RepID=A0ABR1X1G4_9PEZI
MRPTQMLQAGGGDAPLGKYGKYLGGWGNFDAIVPGQTTELHECLDTELLTVWHPTGGSKQRGIITYGLSANRQNPLAGAAHAAIFNSWRRFRGQVLYVAPL